MQFIHNIAWCAEESFAWNRYVAGMHNTVGTKDANLGNGQALTFHQSRGLASVSK